MKLKQRIIAVAALLGGALAGQGQPAGLWNFDSGNLNGTVGSPLTYKDGAGGATQGGTRFGTTTSFGIPNIGGTEANVMQVPAVADNPGVGYNMPVPAVANGGGSTLNDYTLVMDVLFPAASQGKARSLLEADLGLFNADGEFFINSNNNLGRKGDSFGALAADTWYRIGIVVDATGRALRFYVNGLETGVVGNQNLVDQRYALNPGGVAELFTDDNNETAVAYVNSIQLRSVALTKGQMLALGGAQAAGIPEVLPPVPSGVENWIPKGKFASRTTAIGAVVNPGDTTIQDSSISLTLDGVAVTGVSVTRANGLIRVEKTDPGLTLGEHTVVLTLTDSLAGEKKLTNVFTAAIYFEDFEAVTLRPQKDEATAIEGDVWTHVPPAGWTVDNSQFPATIISAENPDDDGDGFADNDGRTEWAGWSFARKDFWVAADNQRRSEFSLADGVVAIADPDEWDDSPHAVSLFNSFLKSPSIPLTGVAANTAFLTFASSWRPEGRDDANASNFPVGPNGEAINNQTAVVSASFDGGAPVELLRWDSISGSPTFHADFPNETVLIPLPNPAGAQNVVLTFALLEAANDWWWAVDNIALSAGASPPIVTTQPAGAEVTEGQAAQMTVAATGEGLSYQWFKGRATGRTAISGATAATLALASAKVEDAGFYSVDIKNASGTVTSSYAKLIVIPSTAGRLVLLSENFDGLVLGPNVDEGVAGDAVWTKTAPEGWSIDDTGVPGVGTDQDGVTEWAGWSFANREWWAQTGGDQQRTGFTKGTGTSAIADSDEWDDVAHAAGNMATYLKTKAISLAGVKANSVIVKFDSSWRAENPQKANVTVSFDGGEAVEIIRYESDEASASFRPDDVNETVALRVNNPAGAQNMVLTFGYFDTRNNWWWAFDNLVVLADEGAIFFEDFEGLTLGANVDEGVAGANVWTSTAPTGWTVNTEAPGLNDPAVGVREWEGWSFASRSWWAQTAGDQRRTEFLRGVGTIAIADGDEWDDKGSPAGQGKMNTYLSTPAIDITGRGAGTLQLKFDSSWRDEPDQKVNIRVAYDGAAPVEVLRWESIEGAANFHDDNPNEEVVVALNNPAGAKSMVITFGYFDAGNNWWWAIDNIEVNDGATPGGDTSITFGVANGQLTLNWTGEGYVLQENDSVANAAGWTAVAGAGANTATVPLTGAAKFYRLRK